MLDYDQNVVPEGAFHQWHREGRAELWAMHGRWAEAEAELRELLGTVGANRYLLVNASSYLALLLGFRGRYHEAADLTDRYREVAIGINDLQAYGEMMLASAHAARGRGDPDGAIDHLERGLRLRGDAIEHDISTVYLFEGTDVLSWLARDASVDHATVDRGLALLRGLVERLDATAPSIGLKPVLMVRNALGGAARLQLRLLTGETVEPDELGPSMPMPFAVSPASSTLPGSTSGWPKPPKMPRRANAPLSCLRSWAPGHTWSVPGPVRRPLGPRGRVAGHDL